LATDWKRGFSPGIVWGLSEFLVFLYSFEVLIKLVIDVLLEGSGSNQVNLTLPKMSLMSEKHTISLPYTFYGWLSNAA
jgi:hypothetical protein